MPLTDAVKIDLTGTPEKFRSAAEEILVPLTELLKELARLEGQSFVLGKRLHQKGRVITFENGVREEIIRRDVLKSKFKDLYQKLLDPHCTAEMLAQRRGCVHGVSYPSDLNCLRTGCTIVFTMKSAHKAVVDLMPDGGSIPYDLSDPDVRYIVEGFTDGPPYHYDYFMKYRFTMKASEDGWKIDAVHSGASSDSRWRRDYNF